ncbi:Hypothetical protein FKW44_021894 [Caligus rogercresseyi]|uniref:Uncharacterized protein n=1 Tax=Caligus rogercresseyi TaxID=217165 RepID=A0A7T8GRZ7_CALRO|nr:Hypothetical protein FKW44_021894 [Caligus rogercresseyi]
MPADVAARMRATPGILEMSEDDLTSMARALTSEHQASRALESQFEVGLVARSQEGACFRCGAPIGRKSAKSGGVALRVARLDTWSGTARAWETIQGPAPRLQLPPNQRWRDQPEDPGNHPGSNCLGVSGHRVLPDHS